MLSPSSQEIALKTSHAVVLAASAVALFLYFESLLVSMLLTQRLLDDAQGRLERGRSLPSQSLLIKKSLAYQGALKLLDKACRVTLMNPRPYNEYAQVMTEIAEDAPLRSSLDIPGSIGPADVRSSCYRLALLKTQAALEREPTNAVYHQRLGNIYDKLSEEADAQEELGKAVQLDPQNISIHLFLSQYFLSKGKLDDFNAHLNRAVQLYRVSLRGGPLADMVERFLREVGRSDLINRVN